MLLPAIVSSTFDPPAGQDPYSLVFDLTGEVAHDRPEKVRLSIVFVSDMAARNPPYSVHIQGPNQPYMSSRAFNWRGGCSPKRQGIRTFTAALVRDSRQRLARGERRNKASGSHWDMVARVSSHLGCN
jgi:hypothetical protein